MVWFGNCKFIVGVTAIVVRVDGGVLLLKHVFRDREYWALPGGWIKSGEHPVQALKRELMEELGLEVTVPQFVDVVVGVYPDQIGFVYRCAAGSAAPSRQGLEVSEWAFFDVDDLPSNMSAKQRAQIERDFGAFAG